MRKRRSGQRPGSAHTPTSRPRPRTPPCPGGRRRGPGVCLGARPAAAHAESTCPTRRPAGGCKRRHSRSSSEQRTRVPSSESFGAEEVRLGGRGRRRGGAAPPRTAHAATRATSSSAGERCGRAMAEGAARRVRLVFAARGGLGDTAHRTNQADERLNIPASFLAIVEATKRIPLISNNSFLLFLLHALSATKLLSVQNTSRQMTPHMLMALHHETWLTPTDSQAIFLGTSCQALIQSRFLNFGSKEMVLFCMEFMHIVSIPDMLGQVFQWQIV
ncbi:Protein of unknown function [Gryllus bimaculatus]|nr:Protein of unknown function [Gryllus bimaculatus]